MQILRVYSQMYAHVHVWVTASHACQETICLNACACIHKQMHLHEHRPMPVLPNSPTEEEHGDPHIYTKQTCTELLHTLSRSCSRLWSVSIFAWYTSTCSKSCDLRSSICAKTDTFGLDISLTLIRRRSLSSRRRSSCFFWNVIFWSQSLRNCSFSLSNSRTTFRKCWRAERQQRKLIRCQKHHKALMCAWLGFICVCCVYGNVPNACADVLLVDSHYFRHLCKSVNMYDKELSKHLFWEASSRESNGRWKITFLFFRIWVHAYLIRQGCQERCHAALVQSKQPSPPAKRTLTKWPLKPQHPWLQRFSKEFCEIKRRSTSVQDTTSDQGYAFSAQQQHAISIEEKPRKNDGPMQDKLGSESLKKKLCPICLSEQNVGLRSWARSSDSRE